MTRRSAGNGDVCPLFPEHGQMLVTSGNPPKQLCPHVEHDGGPRGSDGAPRSRALWPYHGFEESVASYMARLDRAIRQAKLPDLSDLEV